MRHQFGLSVETAPVVNKLDKEPVVNKETEPPKKLKKEKTDVKPQYHISDHS